MRGSGGPPSGPSHDRIERIAPAACVRSRAARRSSRGTTNGGTAGSTNRFTPTCRGASARARRPRSAQDISDDQGRGPPVREGLVASSGGRRSAGSAVPKVPGAPSRVKRRAMRADAKGDRSPQAAPPDERYPRAPRDAHGRVPVLRALGPYLRGAAALPDLRLPPGREHPASVRGSERQLHGPAHRIARLTRASPRASPSRRSPARPRARDAPRPRSSIAR